MGQNKNARDTMLDAAEDIVRESGAAHLTLDAVSARAGVSKGGLLYHFRTKEVLLQSMIERLREVFADVRKAEAAKLPDSPYRGLKAYIHSAGFFQQHRLRGIAAAILAAGAHDPRLLRPAKEAREIMIKELNASGLPGPFTEIVVLAVEGLWVLEMLGVAAPNRGERQAIIDELLRLVDEEDAKARTRGARSGTRLRPRRTRTKPEES